MSSMRVQLSGADSARGEASSHRCGPRTFAWIRPSSDARQDGCAELVTARCGHPQRLVADRERVGRPSRAQQVRNDLREREHAQAVEHHHLITEEATVVDDEAGLFAGSATVRHEHVGVGRSAVPRGPKRR